MTWGWLRSPAYLAAVAVLLLAGASMARLISVYQIHLQKLPIQPPEDRQLSALPVKTASWERVGSDDVMAADIVETLGTTNYVSRLYVRDLGDGRRSVVDFHAAYYTGQIDTVPHVPERCFVGGGLQKGSLSRRIELAMDTSGWSPDASVPAAGEAGAGAGAGAADGAADGVLYRAQTSYQHSDRPGAWVRLPRGVTPEAPIKMNVSEFQLPGGGKLFAGYFFIANGGVSPTAEGVRALAFDLTSDYAYYLKVQATSASVGSAEELAEAAGSLVGELLPEIMRCVPDWTEVDAGRYPAKPSAGGGA